MKMAIKRKYDKFLVTIFKHVNRPRTPKLWAIPHKNAHKTRKWGVFGDALKHVSGLMIVVNRPRTPKLWAITHENSHKMQKQRVFVHNCQTCKSPWNSKMCAIAHENVLKGENDEFLVITLKHVPGHIPMRIPLERQNCGQYLMKMAIKHENKKFLFTHSNMYRVLRSF